MTLPKALILEQSSLANVCTRVQFAARDCPKDSIYGYAQAETPLLDGPLKGPVYLRSSDNDTAGPGRLPCTARWTLSSPGASTAVKGRLRNTFDVVPDVPVSKFMLTVRGGKKRGLLVNTTNLCARKQKAIARFKAQNGKKANMRLKLRTACKRKAQKGKAASGSRRRLPAQIGWLVGRIRISLTSTPGALLERVDHRLGDVVVAAAPSRPAGCRRRACRSSPARSE